MARGNPKKTSHKGAHKSPPKPSPKKPTKSASQRLGPADLGWIPTRLRGLYREAYPHFSEEEMERRRHGIERIMEAAKIEHLLVCGASHNGTAVPWLTGWPVTAEAIAVLTTGLQISLFVQHYNHVPLARQIQDYAVRVVLATHPENPEATALSKQFLRYGASPRGLQAIILASKIRALLEGRYAVSIDDIRHVAAPALRHRLILNFEGEAEGVKADTIIAEILKATKEA